MISACISTAVHLGPFQSTYWLPHDTNRRFLDSKEQQRNLLNLATRATFVVALKHRHPSELKEELLAVSTPQNAKYGKHLSVDQIRSKYAPHEEDAWSVVHFFENMGEATVELNKLGTMMLVTAPIAAIEEYLSTSLSWHVHEDDLSKLHAATANNEDSISEDLQRMKRSLRATSAMAIPDNVADHISFVSLNTPISHNIHPDMRRRASLKPTPDAPSTSTASTASSTSSSAASSTDSKTSTDEPRRRKTTTADAVENENARSAGWREMLAKMHRHDAEDRRAPLGGPNGHVYVTEGNEEVLIRFFPRCADGELNQMNPPCGAVASADRWTRRTTTTTEGDSSSSSSSSSYAASYSGTSCARILADDPRRRQCLGLILYE